MPHVRSHVWKQTNKRKQLIQVEEDLRRTRKDVKVLAARAEEWMNMIKTQHTWM